MGILEIWHFRSILIPYTGSFINYDTKLKAWHFVSFYATVFIFKWCQYEIRLFFCIFFQLVKMKNMGFINKTLKRRFFGRKSFCTHICSMYIRAGRFEKDLQLFSSLIIIYVFGCADHENQNDTFFKNILGGRRGATCSKSKYSIFYDIFVFSLFS